MYTESLTPIVTTLGTGFLMGLMLGYFVKKILKILMFAMGGIVGLLLYLQHQEIISVNMSKLEQSANTIFASVLSSFDKMTQIGGAISLGIPLTGGLSAGIVVGLMKG